jgi:hypothetical protein
MSITKTVLVGGTIAVLGAFTTAAEPQFSADRMKAHVTFLADDLSRGAKQARAATRSPRGTWQRSSR